MLTLLVRRLLALVPVLFLVSFISFLLLDLTPGDAAHILAGPNASLEEIEEVRAREGLDDPLLVRYGRFISSAVRGNLGTSQFSSQPVVDAIQQRAPVTASLAAVGSVFAVLFAIPAGVLAALGRNGIFDRFLTAATSVAMSVPSFVVGLLLVTMLALNQRWFPATGYAALGDGVGGWLRHLILPGLAVSVLPGAELARQTRAAMRDTLERDYIRTARAKGLRMPRVVAKHAAKNAAIPVVTVLGLIIGRMLSGAVVVEAVFALPGLGTLAVDAVLRRDIPVVQGVVLLLASTIVLVNLLVDMSYAYFNPKLRD